MNAECLILIAELCLPPQSQDIEIHRHMFGVEAKVKLGDARIGFELETDAIRSSTAGLTRYCDQGACVYFSERPGPSAGEARSVEFRLGARNLSVQAPDAAGLETSLRSLRLLVKGPNGDVLIPLSALKAAANGA